MSPRSSVRPCMERGRKLAAWPQGAEEHKNMPCSLPSCWPTYCAYAAISKSLSPGRMNSLTRRMTSSCIAATKRIRDRSSALLMALMRSMSSVASTTVAPLSASPRRRGCKRVIHACRRHEADGFRTQALELRLAASSGIIAARIPDGGDSSGWSEAARDAAGGEFIRVRLLDAAERTLFDE